MCRLLLIYKNLLAVDRFAGWLKSDEIYCLEDEVQRISHERLSGMKDKHLHAPNL